MTADTAPLPLVVDLDGTLILSDLLVESFCAFASSSPLAAIKTLAKLGSNRAALKAEIAHHTPLDVATLPYNQPLLTWLKTEHAAGRRIYLASASHETYVRAIADHLGVFTGIFASDGTTNLKAQAKADKLCSEFGAKKFDYVGNETADMAVWEQASGVIVTGADKSFEALVLQRFAKATVIETPTTTARDYLRALRPHQWLKNLLIFVPALAAHVFDASTIGISILAFISFSLCASSGYVLNDLLDLRNDRAHPSKRRRPFASGRINPIRGVALLLGTLAASLFIALFLPAAFLLVLITYYALTLLYSTIIKRHMMLDVILLSLLYGIRLVAGGVALAIPLSPWLLSFSSFFFLSLALIKRCSELIAQQTDPKGRGYRLSDLPLLHCMAASAGYVAVLTSGLYINSTKVSDLYGTPETLWAIPMILLYWISRLLLLTHRGEMHDDPVLFAARDRTSLVCGGLILIVLFASM